MRCGLFLSISVSISLLSAGCPQVVFELDDDDGPADDDATGDDDTLPPDDDDSAAAPCADGDWPDLAASLTDACHVPPEPGEYDLVMTMNYAGPANCDPVRVGRMIDFDGTGTIDETDPMQVWRDAQPHCNAELVDHTGTLLLDFHEGYTSDYGAIAEVEPYVYGMEYVLEDSDDVLGVYRCDGGAVWTVPFPWEGTWPWVTHLHMGSSLEILVGARIFDASDGSLIAVLEGLEDADMVAVISADLDLDGRQEIMAGRWTPPAGVGLFDHEGALEAECVPTPPTMTGQLIAVGNLDDDPEGEFVAAGSHGIWTCDSDGTALASLELGIAEPGVLALGRAGRRSVPRDRARGSRVGRPGPGHRSGPAVDLVTPRRFPPPHVPGRSQR